MAKFDMRAACVLLPLLLAGCFGSAANRGSPLYYDMGIAAGDPPKQIHGLALRQLEVEWPSWLDAPAMQYRLSYGGDAQRRSYAGSHWVAPPGELLQQAFKRRLMTGGGQLAAGQARGCQLHVELDEFMQTFDAPGSSRVRVEVRGSLMSPRGEMLLAQQAFSQTRAAGADAGSAAASYGAVLSELATAMDNWLAKVGRETPTLAERCRAG